MLLGLDQFQELRQTKTFTGSSAARTSLLWQLPTLQQEFAQTKMRPHAREGLSREPRVAAPSAPLNTAEVAGSLWHHTVCFCRKHARVREPPCCCSSGQASCSAPTEEKGRQGGPLAQLPPKRAHSWTALTHCCLFAAEWS